MGMKGVAGGGGGVGGGGGGEWAWVCVVLSAVTGISVASLQGQERAADTDATLPRPSPPLSGLLHQLQPSPPWRHEGVREIKHVADTLGADGRRHHHSLSCCFAHAPGEQEGGP